MVWAGVVNDEHFSTGGRSDSSSAHEVRQTPTGTSRRASMDGARGGAIGHQSAAPIAQRRRFHSSDDSHPDFLDEEEAALDSDDHKACGEENMDTNYCGQYEPIVRRRISLHASVERAVAYVNTYGDDDFDDDLSPFGNRRDSLFS